MTRSRPMDERRNVQGRTRNEAMAERPEDRIASIRARIDDALETCSRRIVDGMLQPEAGGARTAPRSSEEWDEQEERELVRFLGQLAAGIGSLDAEALPPVGAGFGSTVVVEDLERGEQETYVLVTGRLIDFDAGQVSLASPIGSALLGRHAGEEVEVRTPQRLRRLRLVSVTTLPEWLASVEDRAGVAPLPASDRSEVPAG
jgi:transcription elongation GreA/GreB family factor